MASSNATTALAVIASAAPEAASAKHLSQWRARRSNQNNIQRKEICIKMKIPREVFEEILSPLQNGDAEGLEWVEGDIGEKHLKPTSTTQSLNHFKYTLRKGSVIDKIWDVGAHTTRKVEGRWRRGLKSSRLCLSHAAGERGETSELIAMVSGNVYMHLRERRDKMAMPSLDITLMVLTMDKNGHILWPTEYTVETKAALRKRVRAHLQLMFEDPLFPTTQVQTMQQALTMASGSLRLTV
ncbi:hypothetical protein AB1Y20_021841 [Prymnesium parvum]|uniref:Uncharacterized protein n=1 Tax=Prymnesium parvum TaxID=97485 RepID=A0AB34JMM8_PRYPA